MRAQDEFRRLRRSRQYAGVDDRTLMSYARDRAEQYRPQTQEQIEHFAWVQERKDLFGDNMYDFNCWSGYEPKDQHHGAWKMHLYSVNEADWREMCDVVIPYLKQNDVEWKTFCAGYMPEELGGNQAGKAFTVYPKNNQDMAKVARDLDALIRQHRLETANSHIVGDNQMGSTGRLFYRYELSSGQYKDQILDLNNPNDNALYHQLYDSNRGEGNYLAFDMTEADDIWRNFDPSAQNARSNFGNSNVNSKYDISYDVNINGFRRNPNAQTNVKGIRPNEVQVGGNYTGYSSFTDGIYKNVDADLRNGFLTSNANSFVAYNAANDVTSIGIKTKDAYGRAGIFNITIRGQVSENEAVSLLAHLESKNLLPTGKSNSYSMKDVDARYLQSIARRIQEEVATFFHDFIN